MRKIKAPAAEEILARLAAVLEGDRKATPKQIEELLTGLYKGWTEDFTPFIHALPSLAPVVSKDVAPVIGVVMSIISNLSNSREFKKAWGEFANGRAVARMASMKAYQKAGFSKTEAFKLVLADASKQVPMPNLSGFVSSSE